MGRPTKLTPKLQKAMCEHIKRGNYAATTAKVVGINEATFYNWLNRGREEKKGKYFNFFQAIKEAENVAEIRYVERLDKIIMGEADNNGKPTWQAAAWYLERKHPDRWGRRERVDLKHSGSLDQKVKVDIFAEIDKLEATLKCKKKLKSQDENE